MRSLLPRSNEDDARSPTPREYQRERLSAETEISTPAGYARRGRRFFGASSFAPSLAPSSAASSAHGIFGCGCGSGFGGQPSLVAVAARASSSAGGEVAGARARLRAAVLGSSFVLAAGAGCFEFRFLGGGHVVGRCRAHSGSTWIDLEPSPTLNFQMKALRRIQRQVASVGAPRPLDESSSRRNRSTLGLPLTGVEERLSPRKAAHSSQTHAGDASGEAACSAPAGAACQPPG